MQFSKSTDYALHALIQLDSRSDVIMSESKNYPVQGAAQRDHQQPDMKQCLVEKVMHGAERQLHRYLREHSIQSVLDEAFKRCGHDGNKK